MNNPVSVCSRLLVCGFTLIILHTPVATQAQTASAEPAARGWDGPTLRGRVRVYGSFESIEAPDDDTSVNDGYLRRVDLTVRGALLPRLNYYLKTEHKEAEYDIRDGYLAYDAGLLTIQAGFIDPIDEIIQPAYKEFMEVSATEGFPPGNQLGVGLLHEADNWTFFVAAMRHTIDVNDVEKAGTLFSTRFTAEVPMPENYMLHIGAYASWRKAHAEQDLFRYDARSLLRTGERYLDTGKVADRELLMGGEAALGIGALSLESQCVIIRASVPDPLASNSYLNSCYFAGIWNITGEKRNYGGGGFSLMDVERPVTKGGPGIWQVGLRYETIDLNDGAIQGGEQDSWVLALNWYLHDQFWISANYAVTTFYNQDYHGYEVDGLGARVQYLFEW